MNDAEVRELYLAAYPRLVATVAMVAGDFTDAEDLVQDAFARLLPVWSRVVTYEDPEAWVRSVALRLLSNRRRKIRNGVAAVRRLGSAPLVPALDAVGVDVAAALRALPLGQRQVVVLHYLLGLDVRAVARQLHVAEGTVKSRLSRARAALAPLLTEDLHV